MGSGPDRVDAGIMLQVLQLYLSAPRSENIEYAYERAMKFAAGRRSS